MNFSYSSGVYMGSYQHTGGFQFTSEDVADVVDPLEAGVLWLMRMWAPMEPLSDSAPESVPGWPEPVSG